MGVTIAKGIEFKYHFDQPGAVIEVSGNTIFDIKIEGWGGVRGGGKSEVLHVSFDEASTLRALLTQALFLRQDEQERDAG